MGTISRPNTTLYARALLEYAGLDAVAGAWLFLSAFLLHRGVDSVFINNLACGALTVILAFGPFAHAWFAWFPAAIGAWVMMSPLLLGFSNNAPAMFNNAATGIVILISAADSYAVTKTARDVGVTGD